MLAISPCASPRMTSMGLEAEAGGTWITLLGAFPRDAVAVLSDACEKMKLMGAGNLVFSMMTISGLFILLL